MEEQNSELLELAETCQCSRCSLDLPKEELEAHICSEHIDYFPYSCGHCGHFFATDVLAHFHANMKEHFPMKIREHPNLKKLQELRSVMADSLQDAAAADNALKGMRPQSRQMASSSKGGARDQSLRGKRLSSQVSSPWTMLEAEQSRLLEALVESTGSPQKEKRKKTSYSRLGKEAPCHRCGVLVAEEDQMNHSLTHRLGPAPFACRFCIYVANSDRSVRTHVQMRHRHCRPSTKGVKRLDVENTEMSPEELLQICFKSSEETALDKVSTTQDEPSENMSKDGEVEPLYTREVVLPNGKVYRMMQCHECGEEVCEAEASAHVYQRHICWDNLIQCTYCQFQSSHDWAAVRQHLAEAHPKQKAVIRDRRRGAKARMLLKQWIRLCFSDKVDAILKIGHRKGDEDRKKMNKKAQTPVEQCQQRLCHLCSSWVDPAEVDSHVWQSHSSDNLPYNCRACGEGEESLEHMENHWRNAHENSMTMEVVPNPSAREHFDALMVKCFPDEASIRWAIIKTEPEDYYDVDQSTVTVDC